MDEDKSLEGTSSTSEIYQLPEENVRVTVLIIINKMRSRRKNLNKEKDILKNVNRAGGIMQRCLFCNNSIPDTTYGVLSTE